MRAVVIDDSRAMRRIVSRTLEGLGYETVPAEHGRAGLDVLAGGSPADVCRVELSWRGRPLTVSVQGAVPTPQDNPHNPQRNPPDENEVPL